MATRRRSFSYYISVLIFFSDTLTRTHTYIDTNTGSIFRSGESCGGWRVGKIPPQKSGTERPVECVIDETDYCSAVWSGQWPGEVPHQRSLTCV